MAEEALIQVVVMPARVCQTCDIAYPYLVTECRACGVTLTYSGTRSPDEDWELAAEAAMSKGRVLPLAKCGAVRDHHGRYWLYVEDLHRAGIISPLTSFQLLELVDGSIVEVQGYDESRRKYWVEVVGRSGGA